VIGLVWPGLSDNSDGDRVVTRSASSWRGARLDHLASGAGTRLRRPPLATFEPTGTEPRVRPAPMPRCLSLLARRRLRRAPAPDGTRLDPDAARHRARIPGRPARRVRAARTMSAPNKAAGSRAGRGTRACCWLLTFRPSAAGGGDRAEAASSEQEETAGLTPCPDKEPRARELRRPRAVAAGARAPPTRQRCRA